MAYMSQERKAEIAPVVKAILKKYNVKGSLSVRNHMTLCLTIKSGPIDFIENYLGTSRSTSADYVRKSGSLQVNTYWVKDHFTDTAKEFLTEVVAAMNGGNWDKSDIQSDYFNVGWYIDVSIGNWNKPYILVK
jgi:hypothetical protein